MTAINAPEDAVDDVQRGATPSERGRGRMRGSLSWSRSGVQVLTLYRTEFEALVQSGVVCAGDLARIQAAVRMVGAARRSDNEISAAAVEEAAALAPGEGDTLRAPTERNIGRAGGGTSPRAMPFTPSLLLLLLGLVALLCPPEPSRAAPVFRRDDGVWSRVGLFTDPAVEEEPFNAALSATLSLWQSAPHRLVRRLLSAVVIYGGYPRDVIARNMYGYGDPKDPSDIDTFAGSPRAAFLAADIVRTFAAEHGWGVSEAFCIQRYGPKALPCTGLQMILCDQVGDCQDAARVLSIEIKGTLKRTTFSTDALVLSSQGLSTIDPSDLDLEVVLLDARKRRLRQISLDDVVQVSRRWRKLETRGWTGIDKAASLRQLKERAVSPAYPEQLSDLRSYAEEEELRAPVPTTRNPWRRRLSTRCTCSNGSPATGSACTSNGAKCASCNAGYYLSWPMKSCDLCTTCVSGHIKTGG